MSIAPSPPSRPLAALAAAALLLSGCLGAKTAVEDDSLPKLNATPSPEPPNATLPQDRGEGSGLKETNKTEKGLGGRKHTHDYWGGAGQVVLFDDVVYLSPLPLFPDGEGSQPRSVAYVKLPAPKLVYEGADRVDVEASDATLAVDSTLPTAPNPAPPALMLQYRSAADDKWRDPVALPLGKALSISVKPKETDMPHSVSSLWVFRLETDRPDVSALHLKITAHHGRDVDDWPGHPDFYADADARVILDKDVKTHMTGIQEGTLYDGSSTWVSPEKLVSYGTSRLEIYAEIIRATASTGAPATGFFLEHHNATVIGPEIQFGDRTGDGDGTNDLKSYNFTLKVDPAGMDGPYQPASRWAFRVLATFANVNAPTGQGVGLCPGCFPYDIEYHLRIVAVHEDDAKALDA